MAKAVETVEWDPGPVREPPVHRAAPVASPPNHVVEHAAQPAPRPKVSVPFVPPQPVVDKLGPFRSNDDGLTPSAYEDQ